MPSFQTPCPQSARRAAMVLLACVIGATICGCNAQEEPVQIRFALADVLPSQHVQFYVHTIELLTQDGKWNVLEIEAKPPWQSDRLALIELKSDPSSAARNVVTGRADERRYTGVRFIVGVPFDLNHDNPLTASAPLDRPDMFWTWQSGYKFLRIDLSATEHEAAFHLGSTGCSSASALRPPAQACAQPNSIRVELRGFDPLKQAIHVRTSHLAAALSTAARRACTGDYDAFECRAAYALTGLNLDSGTCAQSMSADTEAALCATQQLFFVDPAGSDD